MRRDAGVGSCESRYVKERNLIEVDCIGCDAQPDLRRQKCLTGALLSLDGKLRVEQMTLSGTIVKRYSVVSVSLLSQMRRTLDTISAVKAESLQRIRQEKSRKERKRCRRCQYEPGKLFVEIQTAFLRDLTEFFSSLRCILESAPDNLSQKCEICLFQTKRDVLVLFDEALALRRSSLRDGLRIVEE
ncbi:MAG: hypothetical protein ACE5QF_02410 [Thermoplasmata archaeon]